MESQEDQGPSISQEVLQDVIQAMKKEGGEVEQTVRIGAADEVDIGTAEDVDIGNGGDSVDNAE